MVAAATADNMHTHQMDVTTAFLYASLEEEVYMELMEGVEGYGQHEQLNSINELFGQHGSQPSHLSRHHLLLQHLIPFKTIPSQSC